MDLQHIVKTSIVDNQTELQYVLATWHFHIEVSSRCTLKCPRCARQEVPESLINNQLRLDFFKKTFTPTFIKKHIDKITFCGDDGDPIYAMDLIEIIKYFKSVKDIKFTIITNGIHRKKEWWAELGSVLTQRDEVHFSIDGFDNESNNLYRVNSNFDSIVDGVVALRNSSDCYMTWAAIAFKFNEDHIDQMKSMASNLGFDSFQLTLSTKFGSFYEHYGANDPLEPSKKYISSTDRFQRSETKLSDRIKVRDDSEKIIKLYDRATDIHNNVTPICMVGGKGLFIDSSGKLLPCCWVANRYSHNGKWLILKNKFDLNKLSIDDVLSDPFWSNDFLTFDSYECRTKCNKLNSSITYTATW